MRALIAILVVASVKIKAESFQSCGFQILLRKSFLEILFMVGQTIVPFESVRSKGTTQPKALVVVLLVAILLLLVVGGPFRLNEFFGD